MVDPVTLGETKAWVGGTIRAVESALVSFPQSYSADPASFGGEFLARVGWNGIWKMPLGQPGYVFTNTNLWYHIE